MSVALAVGAGGVVGAVARHIVGEAVETRAAATLAVNVAGSFALGAVLAAPVGDVLASALGVGFCGAFTTFSSFAVETVELAESGRPRRALGNAAGTLVAALLAVSAGTALVGAL